MSTSRTLRKEASALLAATKSAFKFIRDNAVGNDEERESFLLALRQVIDRADPPNFDEKLTTVQLVMTNTSASRLLDLLSGLTDEDGVATSEAAQEGLRRTKQRAYLRFDIDHCVLRRLHYVLTHMGSATQDRVFKRLASQIEKEVLDKNPMEILGMMGL